MACTKRFPPDDPKRAAERQGSHQRMEHLSFGVPYPGIVIVLKEPVDGLIEG